MSDINKNKQTFFKSIVANRAEGVSLLYENSVEDYTGFILPDLKVRRANLKIQKVENIHEIKDIFSDATQIVCDIYYKEPLWNYSDNVKLIRNYPIVALKLSTELKMKLFL